MGPSARTKHFHPTLGTRNGWNNGAELSENHLIMGDGLFRPESCTWSCKE